MAFRDPEKKREYYREWRKKNKASIAASNKKWEQNNPEKKALSHKKWLDNHQEHVQARSRRNRLRQYNMTVEEYDDMIRVQGGVCAIDGCGGRPSGRWNRLFVDHDHKTGKVRKLLCLHCNSAIGYLRDNPERAIAISEYLRNHE
jgi:hypothetical protein